MTANPTSWQKFGNKLDTAQLQVLTGLYKKTEKYGGGLSGTRKLKKEVSDVTMASDGFPAMLATSSASETELMVEFLKPLKLLQQLFAWEPTSCDQS